MAFGKKPNSGVTIRITMEDGTIHTLRLTLEEAKEYIESEDSIYAEYGYIDGIGYPLEGPEDLKAGMYIPARQEEEK